ncbi:MAG: tRNA (adenosine(37)-N6)-threonylcarbamoyltransferase complex dimerization subunit type 1 TsaB [Zoogloeaceae bacterium]|jgi:tRNA threonylcarbamoyladenosine biosynthesis protein TsaB|nr:tRNA (adenosine(37)-N6)-threonylcarbamoyltransferase complex dimerization subunit type 1 TsaB [Zoogloeaceae bacterium]
MRILALETSTESGSCALWQEGALLTADCPAGQAHSETLIPLAARLCADAGCALPEVDAIAFGMGPGAFTGLRVACGIAQGMAVALDVPLVPVGSLEAMAWAARAERVVSLLDARMGEVYCGAFRREATKLLPVMEPVVAAPALLALPEEGLWLAVGNALRVYPELAARVQEFSGWRMDSAVLPHAGSVAELGALAFARGETIAAEEAQPRYVRNKVVLRAAVPG